MECPRAVGRLVVPSGEPADRARHGRRITDDDLRAENSLRPLLAHSGWRLDAYTYEDDRFLALAVRMP